MISPAIFALPQAPPALPTAVAGNDGDAAATGFAQALLVAGFNGRASFPTLPSAAGAQISTGSHGGGKNAGPQPEDEDKLAAAAVAAAPLPAAPAAPFRGQPFARMTGDREQALGAQSSWKETEQQPQPTDTEVASPVQAPVAAPAFYAAAGAPSAAGQPAATRATGVYSTGETSNPPAPGTPPLASTSELAFAARMQPAATASAAPTVSLRPLLSDTAVSAQASSKKITESDVAGPTAVSPIAASAGASAAFYGHASANTEVPSPPPAPASTPSRQVEAKWAPDIQPKPAAVPLKDISSQVAQPDAQISTVSYGGGKSAKPQPEGGDKLAAAAAVAAPLPAAAALPFRVQPSSKMTGNHELARGAQSSWKETERQAQPTDTQVAPPVQAPVTAPAFTAAAEAPPDAGQPAVTRAAGIDPVGETSNPPAPGAPPLAPTGELAFAARVQPAATASAAPSAAPTASPRPLQSGVAVPAQASSKKMTESDDASPTAVSPIAARAGASAASYGHAFANPEVPSPPPAPASTASTPSRPVEAKWAPEVQPKSAAVPLKDISLQVAQPGAQKVEVRVVQQSGELRVAVRTGDSDLAHGLQQGLSDLVGRLQEDGSRAEAWRPGSTVASTPVLESRTNSGASQNGDGQSYSGGSHQRGEGERRQGQFQRPGWVEELENSTGGGEQSQGASYGIGS